MKSGIGMNAQSEGCAKKHKITQRQLLPGASCAKEHGQAIKCAGEGVVIVRPAIGVHESQAGNEDAGKQRGQPPKGNSQRKIERDVAEGENAKGENPARSQPREGAPNERLQQHPGKAADLVVCRVKSWIQVAVAIANVHPLVDIIISSINPIWV